MIVIQLLLVNPSTSETPERSFSLTRWIKAWLRSSMKQLWFNAMAVLHAHKNLMDQLDLVHVGNDFVSLSETRYRYFGTFVKPDLNC